MSNLPTKKSARFRKLLPVVEAKLEEGYSYEEAVEILKKEYDLDLTLGVFRNYLYKERKNQHNPINQSESQATNKEPSVGKVESDDSEDLNNYFSKLKKDIEKEKQNLTSSESNQSLFKKG